MSLANEIVRRIEDALSAWRITANQLPGQIPGSVVAPATASAAGVVALSDATPATVGTAASGDDTAASRGDHIHAHGVQTGGTLHSAATSATAGFLAATDKTKLDAYPVLSGLATGAVLRATSATTAAFGAVDLADSDAVTGTLPAARLGSGTPAANTVLLGNKTWSGAPTLSGDIAANSDGAGLMQRGANMWCAPSDHFNNTFSGWTWATDAPFDGSPSTVDVTTYPSILRLVNDSITEDHFAYQAAIGLVRVTARLTLGITSYTGVRIDDGTNSNYTEIRLESSATYTRLHKLVHYSCVGGVVTATVTIDALTPQFFLLRLAYRGDLASGSRYTLGYMSTDSPILVNVGIATGLSWTPSRTGFVFGQRGGTDDGSMALVDWIQL